MKLLILNGPNLNMLGEREPETYGNTSLESIQSELERLYPAVEFEFYQSNHEGELIDSLHGAAEREIEGVVFNPGGYSHTSVALRDAIGAIGVPVIEVHISNIAAREAFRHHSVTAGAALGSISGMGTRGYSMAVNFFLEDGSD